MRNRYMPAAEKDVYILLASHRGKIYREYREERIIVSGRP